MKNCRECGTKITSIDIFCAKCGAPTELLDGCGGVVQKYDTPEKIRAAIMRHAKSSSDE